MQERIKPSKVAVIGSGIAGALSAILLAREGFDVTLIEERTEVLSGTSALALQVHLGGLYSGNQSTAQECLRSAIDFKRSLPFAVNDQMARFLIADASEMPWEDYLDFYRGLRDHYGSMPTSQQVFGPPDQFFSVLQPSEYAFAKNVHAGICTQEPGLNMSGAHEHLSATITELRIQLLTSTEVKAVIPNTNYFVLELSSAGKTIRKTFDQVINAGGYKSRLLDHQLGDRTEYTLFLKAWNLVRHTKGQVLPPFYVVRGNFMHYTPVGQLGLASIIVATYECSYLETAQYDRDNPALPYGWEEILLKGVIPNKQARQHAILEYAQDNFITVPDLENYDLIPGISVSYSPWRQDRTHRGINHVVPGWQTIIPTKATNALELARQAAIDAVLHASN